MLESIILAIPESIRNLFILLGFIQTAEWAIKIIADRPAGEKIREFIDWLKK